jgi:hypothetical protein
MCMFDFLYETGRLNGWATESSPAFQPGIADARSLEGKGFAQVGIGGLRATREGA